MKKLVSFLIAASADAVISKITGTSCSLVRDANQKTMKKWEAKKLKEKQEALEAQAKAAAKCKSFNPALLGFDGDVSYGYNVNGDFVPLEIGGKRISYGYNCNGDFVPLEIDGKRISYGFNCNGDFVPLEAGGKSVSYSYNLNGDFVALEVGNEKVSYGYNLNGDFAPSEVGGQKVSYGYNLNGDFVPKTLN